jgi:hypothetical protein
VRGVSLFFALWVLMACSFDPYTNAEYCRGRCPMGTYCFKGFCIQDNQRGGSADSTAARVGVGRADAGRSPPNGGAVAGNSANAKLMTPLDGGADAGNAGDVMASGVMASGVSGASPGPNGDPPAQVGNGSAAGSGGGGNGGTAGIGSSGGGSGGGTGGTSGGCQVTSTTDGCTTTGMALDDDCDGSIDEDCTGCMDGQQQDCYPAGAATLGVGLCRAGKQTCSMASFGPCQGAVTPQDESCANSNADDDCNGVKDDIPGVGAACTISAALGTCRTGTLRCTASSASPVCMSPTPTAETCNGRDDDCDGKTDEDFDLANDTAHCGACDRACASAQSCCAGHCTDLGSDVSHCGTCAGACSAGDTCCAGSCIDLQSSNGNCGACGTDCGLLNLGGVLCQCQAGRCAAPLGLCLL